MKNKITKFINNNLTRLIKIIFLLVIILGIYILGYAKGLSNSIESSNGKYNIEVSNGDKVTITTKLNYIKRDEPNNRLIIYGKPTYYQTSEEGE